MNLAARPPLADFVYPVRWIGGYTTPDGRRVTIRPVLPQDAGVERELVARGLNAQSRYQRFHMGLSELPQWMADRLTRIDYHRHFALIVESFDKGRQTPVADGRFARDEADDERAEFALAVANAWQGQGIGQHLLRTLIEAAADEGVRLLYGDVLRTNHAMIALARGAGFRAQAHPDDARLLRWKRALGKPSH